MRKFFKELNCIDKIAFGASILYLIALVAIVIFDLQIKEAAISSMLVKETISGSFLLLLVFLVLPTASYLFAIMKLRSKSIINFYRMVFLVALNSTYTYMICIMLIVLFFYKEKGESLSTNTGKIAIFFILLIILLQIISYYIKVKNLIVFVNDDKLIDSFFKYSIKFFSLSALIITVTKAILLQGCTENDSNCLNSLFFHNMHLTEMILWGMSFSLLFYELFLFKLSSIIKVLTNIFINKSETQENS